MPRGNTSTPRSKGRGQPRSVLERVAVLLIGVYVCYHAIAPGSAFSFVKSCAAPARVKLTYFDAEGKAEKVRLALVLGGIEFEDNRIPMEQWGQVRDNFRLGRVTTMAIDGAAAITQSEAMLRYVGSLSSPSLYPEEPKLRARVGEVLGLVADIEELLVPSWRILTKPQIYGYEEDLSQESRQVIYDSLMVKLLEPDSHLTKFLHFLDGRLGATGTGFFAGPSATIADCAVLAQLRLLKQGRPYLAGECPSRLLGEMPSLESFYAMLHSIPQIKQWYD